MHRHKIISFLFIFLSLLFLNSLAELIAQDTLAADSHLLEIYLEQLAQVQEDGRAEELIPLYNNIGVVFQEQGQLAQALDYHLRALELARKRNDKIGLAASSNNLGIVHYRSGSSDKALEYFSYSLQLKQELGNRSGMKQTYNNMASVYLERYQYDSALHYYYQSLELEQEESFPQTGVTLNNIGQLYMVKGELGKAEKYFRQALAQDTTEGNRRMLASVYDNLGLLYFHREDYQISLSCLDSSLYLAELSGDPEGERLACLHLSELHAGMGDYRSAYNYFRRYERLSGMYLEERSQVIESEALYVKQQKENEILRLSLVIAALVLVAVAALVVIVFLRLRQKNRLVQALAEQQQLRFQLVLEAQEMERKRIAGDLHDSLGQLLSVVKMSISDLEDTMDFRNPEQQEQMNKVLEILDEASNEVRKISHNLMPSALIRSGILSAVRELVGRINGNQALKMDLYTDSFPERLPEQTEIGLYRIIQELTNNIIRHSGANSAAIEAKMEEGKLRITVTDNGKGINQREIKNSPGIGWKNIFSRAASLNAHINIDTSWGKGSKVVISLPAPENR